MICKWGYSLDGRANSFDPAYFWFNKYFVIKRCRSKLTSPLTGFEMVQSNNLCNWFNIEQKVVLHDMTRQRATYWSHIAPIVLECSRCEELHHCTVMRDSPWSVEHILATLLTEALLCLDLYFMNQVLCINGSK